MPTGPDNVHSAETKQSTPRGHLAYVAVYMAAAVAGLWENSDMRFTVVALFVLMMLAAMPHMLGERFDPRLRSALQHIVSAVAVFWMLLRFGPAARKELALVEGLCLLGGGLFLTTRARHLNHLLLITAVTLVCGAMGPPRLLYLVMLPPCVVFGAFLLYDSRAMALAGTDKIHSQTATIRFRNLPALIVHFILVLAAWMGIFLLLPIRSRLQLAGMPNWNMPDENEEQGNRPSHGRSSQKVQKDQGDIGTYGHVGRDLVMRVRSPLKMYWLANLYDRYDGTKWNTTAKMKKQEIRFEFREIQKLTRFEQVITIEKWFSPIIYSAYLRSGRSIGGSAPMLERKATFFNERIAPGEYYPLLPYTYRVKTYIPLEEDTAYHHWYEEIAPEHYLQLPAAITERTRKLAIDITKNHDNTLDKVLAIRDFLRTEYEYSLRTTPIPRDREQTDYFLFNMSKGHCEYFAGAMAVLGRVIGVPTRVATGFAPGEYNVLTGEFEVYEYHAHAWTQAFVDGSGWITVDATPASAEQMANTARSVSLNTWRNPFSDEWRAKTPELSVDVDRMLKLQKDAEEFLESQRKWFSLFSFSSFKKTEYQALRPRHGSPPDLRNPSRPNEQSRRRRQQRASERQMVATTKGSLAELKDSFKRFIESIRISHIVNTIIICMMLIIVLYITPLIYQHRRYLRILAESEVRFREAREYVDMSPERSIRSAYRVLRDLLDLARLPRSPEEELVEYAANLHHVNVDLSRHLMVIFGIYDRMLYSPVPPTFKDARTVLEHAEEARSFLDHRVKTGFQETEMLPPQPSSAS